MLPIYAILDKVGVQPVNFTIVFLPCSLKNYTPQKDATVNPILGSSLNLLPLAP